MPLVSLQIPNFKFPIVVAQVMDVKYWSGALICILMIFSVAGFIAGFFPEVASKLGSVSVNLPRRQTQSYNGCSKVLVYELDWVVGFNILTRTLVFQ